MSPQELPVSSTAFNDIRRTFTVSIWTKDCQTINASNRLSTVYHGFICIFQRNFRLKEKKKVIVYTTSMTVVRESADKCKAVRNMLQTHMVRYEEKDLFMSNENQKELLERLGTSAIEVPQVFADGIHIGVSVSFLRAGRVLKLMRS